LFSDKFVGVKNTLTFWGGGSFQEPAKLPQGFGVRQSSGALVNTSAFESGRRQPQSKTQAPSASFQAMSGRKNKNIFTLVSGRPWCPLWLNPGSAPQNPQACARLRKPKQGYASISPREGGGS